MTMAKSGTSSDKIAALAYMVQQSPVHNVSALSSLVGLAKVAKKHQFIVVLGKLNPRTIYINILLFGMRLIRCFIFQKLRQNYFWQIYCDRVKN